MANQIKAASPKLIETVKVAHFNPGMHSSHPFSFCSLTLLKRNTELMEKALVVVKALAGQFSRAILLAQGPALNNFEPKITFMISSPPSSSSSTPMSRSGGGGMLALLRTNGSYSDPSLC